jgi:hypothetical protein
MIVSSLPISFQKSQPNSFSVLYRGSRNGFGSSAFHTKCDGQGGTITIVCTTTGCIFGGYIPCVWDLNGGYKRDDSGKSFLFTLKNIHNTSPIMFPLKLSQVQYAIHCSSSWGPRFGAGCDLDISDQSNANGSSYSSFDYSYENRTEYEKTTVLAGASNVALKEIEVFSVV